LTYSLLNCLSGRLDGKIDGKDRDIKGKLWREGTKWHSEEYQSERAVTGFVLMVKCLREKKKVSSRKKGRKSS